MKLSRRKLCRVQQEYVESAQTELTALRDALRQAYDVFNRTADPALLEASILEIGALQSKYDCALRNIKALNEEMQDGTSRHTDPGNSGSRGDRADRAAAETAAKAYQMGI